MNEGGWSLSLIRIRWYDTDLVMKKEKELKVSEIVKWLWELRWLADIEWCFVSQVKVAFGNNLPWIVCWENWAGLRCNGQQWWWRLCGCWGIISKLVESFSGSRGFGCWGIISETVESSGFHGCGCGCGFSFTLKIQLPLCSFHNSTSFEHPMLPNLKMIELFKAIN